LATALTRTRVALGLAGCLAAGLAVLIPAAAMASASAPPAGAAAAMSFGLFKSSNNAQYAFPVRPAYAIQYYGWREGFQTADARAAWKSGTEVFAELQTCGNPCDSTGISIANVTNGTYDTYLTEFADAVRAFGHPVLLTFDHEMNGDWYPWGDIEVTPAQWIAAWQHVTSLISSIAPNVTWVWAPNIEQGAAPVSRYWPGTGHANPHVGVIGLDGYLRKSGSTWANTFSASVADLESVSGGSYPFIVAETGVPAADSDAARQIDSLVSGARSAGATALMYFDSGPEWSLTGTGQSELSADVG
jgi:hypothetical protein